MTEAKFNHSEIKQRFGFRKYLGAGLCAVALSSFFVVNGGTVKADTLTGNNTDNSTVVQMQKDDTAGKDTGETSQGTNSIADAQNNKTSTNMQNKDAGINVQNNKVNTSNQSNDVNTSNAQNGKTSTDTQNKDANVNAQDNKSITDIKNNDVNDNAQSKQASTEKQNNGTDTNAQNSQTNISNQNNDRTTTNTQDNGKNTTVKVSAPKDNISMMGLMGNKTKQLKEVPQDDQDIQKFTEHQAINDIPTTNDAYQKFKPDTKNTVVVIPYGVEAGKDLDARPYVIDLTKDINGKYKKIDLNSYYKDMDSSEIKAIINSGDHTNFIPEFFNDNKELISNGIYNPNLTNNHIIYVGIKYDNPVYDASGKIITHYEDVSTSTTHLRNPLGKLEHLVNQDPLITSQDKQTSKTYHVNEVDTQNTFQSYLSNMDRLSAVIHFGGGHVPSGSAIRKLTPQEGLIIAQNVDPSLYNQVLSQISQEQDISIDELKQDIQNHPDNYIAYFGNEMNGYFTIYDTPYINSPSDKLNNEVKNSVLVPEYHTDGSINSNKWAGILTFASNNINIAPQTNGSMDFTLTYTPLDKEYKGILSPVYIYEGAGDGDDVDWEQFKLAQAASAKLTFHDNTDKKDIGTPETADGAVGNQIKFVNHDSTLADLEKQGYVLDKNDPGNYDPNAVYTLGDNNFVVNLIHGTTIATEKQPVKQEITYVYENGSPAAPTVEKTLTFSRTATKDNVTGKVTYGTWTPETNSFKDVTSPTIQGYIPDISVVQGKTVTPDSPDYDTKVTYYMDKSSSILKFIDDDNNNDVLDTDTASGKVGDTIVFNKYNGDLTRFQNDGYQVVSDNFKNSNGKFIKNGSNYEVHLKHKLTPITDADKTTAVVHEQITYVYADDGSQAAPTVNKNITFTRTGTKDNVTGDITYSKWTPENGSFEDITSPNIDGFTPDISVVQGEKVTPDSKDYITKVTYYKNKDALSSSTLKFIDDDNNDNVLDTDTASGKIGNSIIFNKYNGDLNRFQNDGYQVVSDNFKGNGKFVENGSNYEVHLKHTTTPITNPDVTTKVVHEQITYVYDDGSQASTPVNKSITFTRTGTKDNVTGNVTYGNWTTNNDKFADVTSPNITGYTPDIPVVPGETVTADSPDYITKVTYYKNKDAMSSSILKFIDDDNNQNVLDTDTASGKVNDNIVFNKYQGDLNRFQNDGYQVVSDNFNGKGQFVQGGSNYEVHLKHKTTSITNPDVTTKVVHEQITYVYADDGSQAAPTVNKSITFTRTATQDNVTGNITYGNWTTEKDSFDDVTSPSIKDYSPDITVVKGEKITPDSKDYITKVTYYKNNVLSSSSILKFIDDDNNSNILDTDTASGKVGDQIIFNKYQGDLTRFQNDGYQLVSDNFKGNGKFIKGGNSFEVHLKHKTIINTQKKDVHERITYVYENGTQAAEPVNKTISFTRNVTTDEVTGKIVNGDWQSATNKFTDVTSPDITGYTPDIKVVNGETVTADSPDYITKVTYHKNPAVTSSSTLKFIDDDENGAVLDTDTANGKIGDNINFGKYSNDLSKFTSEGYNVVSDNFNGSGKFVANGSSYEVHLNHKHSTTTENTSVNQKITYVYEDGTQAAKPVEKTIDFTRTNDTDEVTGKTTYGKWTPANGEFTDVTSPTITGYTPDIPVVKGETVTASSPDYIVQVTYKKNGVPQKSDTPTPTPTPQPSQPTQPTQPTVPSQPTTVPQPNQPTQPTTPSEQPSTPETPEPMPSDQDVPTPKPTTNKSTTVTPHGEKIDKNTNAIPHKENTPQNNNGGLHGEHVDAQGNIVGANGQTIGHIDANGKAHYTLPQTGSDQSSDEATVLLGGVAVAISMIGLAGVKKRRNN